MKHLLKMMDLTNGDITEILNLADQLKYEQKHGIAHKVLAGKTLGMIFEKASTRTRVSFEVGMYQLGGLPIFLSAGDLQIGRGEPVQDTARVLSRYLDGIMIRTYKQAEVDALAKNGTIPIINGLTDYAHPCQVLADLMTIREYKGALEGLKLCFIGDGNNMMNSLIVGGLKMKMEVAVACPAEYRPNPAVRDFAAAHPAFSMTTDPLDAARGADVLITDVWASMGEEGEAEKRRKAFRGYQINDEVLAAAKPDAMVQHCLPAHRGEEITAKAFEAHAKEIFDEAENRLHAQKAVLVKLLGNK
ncbi:MAG: ornithine carbamoyltransferase [Oscillospiraceae bacterium]|jgi:ornithine carbamoyltransferase|nr:ornithine carbamoyltransferase [Oscillospiraceae bacterium]MCI1990229.1 ornithine carbamoyltransferase [Oscillospiraceae bacterium]MCI2036291.1 ornithine carbamoyltransferase [Oscillospiraceae bacterium]